MPAEQLAHPDEPVFVWYVPATQSVHDDTDPNESLPVPQLVQADAEAAEYLPSGQAAVTAVSPVEAQNDPASHAVHELCPVDAT